MGSIHKLCAFLTIVFLTSSVQAQQTAPSTGSIVKDCAGLKGSALLECQKVAKKMEKTADGSLPESASTKSDPTRTDPTHVHHSSPIMTTEEEKVVAKAREEGKDPAEELKKLKEKNQALEESRKK